MKKEVLKIFGVLGLVVCFALLFLAGYAPARSPEFTMVSIFAWFIAFLMLYLGD